MTCVVVKLGGHALDSLAPSSTVLIDLAHDVAELRDDGVNVVVVHGGGPQIADLLARVGLESKFQDGLRITDLATMQYVEMALSDVNVRIVAALNDAGLASVGICGSDASLLRSESIGEPFDRVGEAPLVNRDVLDVLWSAGLTPVVSPVALDKNAEPLNCNADAVAGALAGTLGADVLVLLSDIDQLLANVEDPTSALTTVTGAQIEAMKHSGASRDGMTPKLTAALDALHGGAERILLANGTRAHALRDALARSIPTTEVVR
ncbi:MAG: acetylglutamate kinase [Acidimicrobiales bacterium]